MTISSSTRSIEYTGDGATSVYAYTYRILDQTHLRVTVKNTSGTITILTLTTDYTVDGVLTGTGGNVTLVSAGQAWLTAGKLTTSYIIRIERSLPISQLTNVRGEGPYKPEIHEDAYDTACMQIQQLADMIGLPTVTSTTTGGLMYMPCGNGAPSGTPTTFTGRVPYYFDATNLKIYIYSGGAWVKTAALS